MKKILLILGLFVFLYSHSSEWVNVKGKDYKIQSIDTAQMIIVCSGYYKVINDSTVNYLGGSGNYFFYTGAKKSINLSDEMIEDLKILTYGIKEANDEN